MCERDVVGIRAELDAQCSFEADLRDQLRLAGQVGVEARNLNLEPDVGPPQAVSLGCAGVLDCAMNPPGGGPAPVLTGLTTSLGLGRIQSVAPATPASWDESRFPK